MTLYLQTSHIRAEELCKFATTSLALALIAHLIVQHVWLHLDTFVNVAMLQLHKARRNRSDVALLVRKCYAAGTLQNVQ